MALDKLEHPGGEERRVQAGSGDEAAALRSTEDAGSDFPAWERAFGYRMPRSIACPLTVL